MTTDIQTIALNKLFHSDANVRRTGNPARELSRAGVTHRLIANNENS